MSRSDFFECTNCGTGYVDVPRLRYRLHQATCGRGAFLFLTAVLLAVLAYVLVVDRL